MHSVPASCSRFAGNVSTIPNAPCGWWKPYTKARSVTWGKTRKSLGVVHVPQELADDLWLWKQRCPNSSPEAFIFPNKKGGFMDSCNYRETRSA